MNTEAYTQFQTSTQIGYEQWHDGAGYDLDALRRMSEAERSQVADQMAASLHSRGGWREIEVLAAIGTAEARKEIREALQSADTSTRLYAARTLADLGEDVAVDRIVVEALRKVGPDDPVSGVLALAESYPSAEVRKALLDLALDGGQVMRVHAAALSLYLAGKATEAFDWDHRPFFLRFGEDDRQERLEAHRELRERVGAF